MSGYGYEPGEPMLGQLLKLSGRQAASR
jgi:hypothetical protein